MNIPRGRFASYQRGNQQSDHTARTMVNTNAYRTVKQNQIETRRIW